MGKDSGGLTTYSFVEQLHLSPLRGQIEVPSLLWESEYYKMTVQLTVEMSSKWEYCRRAPNNSCLRLLDTRFAAGLRCLSESTHQKHLPVADRGGCKDYYLHVSRWSISSGQSSFDHYYKIFYLKGAITRWCSDSCWSGTLEWAEVVGKLSVKVKFSLETPLASVRRYPFPLCGSLCRAPDQVVLPRGWRCHCRV